MKQLNDISISRDEYRLPIVWHARVSYIAACGSHDTLWAEGDSPESAARAGMTAYEAEPDYVPLWGEKDLECVDNFAAYHG